MLFSSEQLLCSCDDSDEPANDRQMVLEAYIDNDGFPRVILTLPFRPSEKPQNPLDHMLRWAKVTITDGQDTSILTGGVDQNVFPPFSYKSFAMRGVVGNTYTINAEYKGLRSSATVKMPTPTHIEDVGFSRVEDKESKYVINARFSIPGATGAAYFVAFAMVKNSGKSMLPCFMGTSLTDNPSAPCSMSIFRPRTRIDIDEYDPYFNAGDTVMIKIANVDKLTYQFWAAYQEQLSFGHSLFFNSSNSLKGNVSGGYGCFTPISSETAIVAMPSE